MRKHQPLSSNKWQTLWKFAVVNFLKASHQKKHMLKVNNKALSREDVRSLSVIYDGILFSGRNIGRTLENVRLKKVFAIKKI